jgi:hypothetical protein
MGEAIRRQQLVQTQALEAMVVDTPGGRIHVQWDHGASATPNAQLTNSTYALEAFGQLYRDRADCENGFDELKNQVGLGRLYDPGH